MSSDAPNALPPAYADPDAYLCQAGFHLKHHFVPSYLPPSSPPQRVTYALVGAVPTSSSFEPLLCLVWIGGLGQHRLASTWLDGLATSHGVRLLVLDRPHSGGSAPVPLKHRFQWSHEALLSILAKEGIRTFDILSHSNGLLYTLHTLLHLSASPEFTVRSWTATSPYVPPWLSNSLALSAAEWIPASATTHFGALIKAASGVAQPLVQASGWSSGIVREALSPGEKEGGPAKELARYVAKMEGKPVGERHFAGRYISSECSETVWEWLRAEGFGALGQEALVALRKDDGAAWGWGGADGGEAGEDGDRALLYERGFEALKKELARSGREVEIRMFHGDSDAMVPQKGFRYLGDLLARLELVGTDAFVGVKGGHDDLIDLDVVMLGTMQRIAGRG